MMAVARPWSPSTSAPTRSRTGGRRGIPSVWSVPEQFGELVADLQGTSTGRPLWSDEAGLSLDRLQPYRQREPGPGQVPARPLHVVLHSPDGRPAVIDQQVCGARVSIPRQPHAAAVGNGELPHLPHIGPVDVAVYGDGHLRSTVGGGQLGVRGLGHGGPPEVAWPGVHHP